MFINFTPFEQTGKTKNYCKILYDYVTKLCKPNTAQKSYRNITINFLTKHMRHFSIHMVKDFYEWHTILNNYLEVDGKYEMIGVLRAFYRSVAIQLLEEYNEDAFQVKLIIVKIQ